MPKHVMQILGLQCGDENKASSDWIIFAQCCCHIQERMQQRGFHVPQHVPALLSAQLHLYNCRCVTLARIACLTNLSDALGEVFTELIMDTSSLFCRESKFGN